MKYQCEDLQVYHDIKRTVNAFYFISSNSPKAVLFVVQQIHGDFYNALLNVSLAASTTWLVDKSKYIIKARASLFSIYTGLEYLINVKCATVGQVNTVIVPLKSCLSQLDAWQKSTDNKVIKAKSEQLVTAELLPSLYDYYLESGEMPI